MILHGDNDDGPDWRHREGLCTSQLGGQAQPHRSCSDQDRPALPEVPRVGGVSMIVTNDLFHELCVLIQ
jgi:hypothetical protein